MNMPFGRATARPIAPADAVAKVNNNEAIIIDVRDINELMHSGKAKGAIHISLMMLQSKADPRHPEFHADLSTDKPVIIYCATGARSGMAAQMMLSYGFSEVYNLGGLMHWHHGGGELEAA